MASIIAEWVVLIQMVQVEIVDHPDRARELTQVLTAVWGGAEPIPPDVIIAIIHAGGYASLASSLINGVKQLVGGSLGIVGNGDRKLHSHVTGVISNATNSGVGRALKEHQWQWAKENELSAISWTFDPLVRRNAHFNLVVLGATAVRYCRNYYGDIDDAINSGDLTDRLVVERQVAGLSSAPSGKTCVASSDDLIIDTPDDIVELRSCDRESANRWRQEQRTSFEAAFSNSRKVRGFTSEGSYILSV